ncbi:beta-N-acetylhexosaminidase [Gayadomonas joobiniege]|uniref:beta-N-acetylhexosaminidase n=1 Tax=Gayadomonas joobiniege TaxID=1234606 RepID=UPI00036C46BB|nr:beta-N-acetylhexosaminidase [Gayadomonas joobiniege]
MSLMIDIEGVELQAEEKERLRHPFVHSVILFARNYQSPAQITRLSQSIRTAAGKPVIIAVDQEGGRVQRFIDGFTRLPSMRSLAQYAQEKSDLSALTAVAYVMACELNEVGIDLSFAPVLDLDGISDVIGSRSFAQDANSVTLYANAYIEGMHLAGMSAVGKHFPGHGNVKADTHFHQAVDTRSATQIKELDMAVFKHFIEADKLQGIMPAHVVYPAIDKYSAGFSKIWLQQILATELGFNGIIFSDDLSMQGAHAAGDYCERAQAALAAGCNIILACNNAAAQKQILANFNTQIDTGSLIKLRSLTASDLYQSTNQRKHLELLAYGKKVAAELAGE